MMPIVMIAIDPNARLRRLRLFLLLQALSVACAQGATGGPPSGIDDRLPVLLLAGALIWLERRGAFTPSGVIERARAIRACLLCATVLLLVRIAAAASFGGAPLI
jgi:hypothetical protein